MIITAVALLRGPVIGTVIFSQLKSNPYSDMSIFMEVSTSNDTASKDHGWHVHEYPISSETDTDLSACQSTKGHYNPFKIETSANRKVQNKNFFTDTTSSLAGITSVLGRSLVIHGADRNPDRIACANITSLHQTSARTGNWSGVGSANGRIIFTQNLRRPGLNCQPRCFGIHIFLLSRQTSSRNHSYS
uniref:Superoxide dismutase copper/zinc binding domain-containing protein n=1 Tax=Erpetoichthys calabaricus TaxID=27687 RepID=A0A8C4S0M9_ERPCA